MNSIKPRRFKFRAFSLAEALITLLIVCLITLASIPILTKKRRDLNSGAHGKWICTRHSLGHLVSWRKGISTTDENDPDSWTPGCTFTAPVNARNFAITVIGGGGGGASGVSELEKIAETTSSISFNAPSDGIYKVAVIGAGGGGGGGLDYKRLNAGGGGASGGVFVGSVNLVKNQRYNLSAGSGGGVAWSALNGCVKGASTAGTGGTSTFSSNGNNAVYIEAKGGNGAQNISSGGYSFWCKYHCYGGSAGSGNNNAVTFKEYGANKLYSYSVDTLRQSYAGTSGGCSSYSSKRSGAGGFSLLTTNLPIANNNVYGGGGNGSHGSYDYEATNGGSGYVGVFHVIRKQGQGGAQAEPVMTTVPSIEGKVSITIGEVADADTNGEPTRVEIFNKHNTRSRLIIGPGGAKGIALETDNNTDGINSVWTDEGGGTRGATCKQNGTIPIYDMAATGEVYTVCAKDTCELQEAPAGYVEGDPTHNKEIASYIDPVTSPSTYYTQAKLQPFFTKIGISYFIAQYPVADQPNAVNYSVFKSSNITTYFQYNNENFESYKNYTAAYGSYAKLKDSGACFNDGYIKYARVCDESKNIDKGEATKVQIGSIKNYECPDAGSGTHPNFGAGGGGGYAFEEPGFAGKGGKGAPGAVIIEW